MYWGVDMDIQFITNTIVKNRPNAVISKNIDITTASSYRGDMEGLLVKKLNIPYNQVNYNIALNGFNSSSDYNGETNILLFDSGTVTNYINL